MSFSLFWNKMAMAFISPFFFPQKVEKLKKKNQKTLYFHKEVIVFSCDFLTENRINEWKRALHNACVYVCVSVYRYYIAYLLSMLQKLIRNISLCFSLKNTHLEKLLSLCFAPSSGLSLFRWPHMKLQRSATAPIVHLLGKMIKISPFLELTMTQ